MESKKLNEARVELDSLLPTLRTFPPPFSLNEFLAQRLQLARNLDEFLEFAPRIPQNGMEEAGYDYSEQELKKNAGSNAPLFDKDSVKILNRGLPLSYFFRAATGKLPAHLKKLLIRTAWVRAALISDNATASQLAGELERTYYQEKGKLPEPAELPSFLSDTDKAAFKAEWAKLAAVPTAPNYFGKIVLSWAEKNPKDTRVPEALSLVVKSTRFGCTDLESGRHSRAAFRLLHSRYPNTLWAKGTPYWFQ